MHGLVKYCAPAIWPRISSLCGIWKCCLSMYLVRSFGSIQMGNAPFLFFTPQSYSIYSSILLITCRASILSNSSRCFGLRDTGIWHGVLTTGQAGSFNLMLYVKDTYTNKYSWKFFIPVLGPMPCLNQVSTIKTHFTSPIASLPISPSKFALWHHHNWKCMNCILKL